MKISSILIFSFLLIALGSCSEDPVATGVITVYNDEGFIVVGAKVVLSQEEILGVDQTNIVSTQFTDSKGQTEHVLENEAVMNVDAMYILDEDTLYYGQSVIALILGKTVPKNVEILPF
jgi:hypothetical protein